MSNWYRGGTISLVNGSTTVTGTGTSWLENVAESNGLDTPSGLKEIESVTSNTVLQLVMPYSGPTISGVAYSIIPTQGVAVSLVKRVVALLTASGVVKDAYAAGELAKTIDLDKRAALLDLAAATGSALLGYDGGTVQDIADRAKTLQDYTALRAYTGRAKGLRITTTGIAGDFELDAGDTTSADNGGTVIVGAAGRRWKRLFDGPYNLAWFGARPWPTNSNDAFKALAAVINAEGGGSVVIPPWTYKVGKQTLAGATGKGYSWNPDDVFRITGCTLKPVVVYCDGAVIRNDPTMRYGAFDPVSGVAMTSVSSNKDTSAAFPTIFRFKNNASVRVVGQVEIDGLQNGAIVNNLQSLEDWGYGLHFDANLSVQVDSAYVHHNPCDNVMVADTGLTPTSLKRSHIFQNLKLSHAGRNNFSVVGANSITVIASEASFAATSVVSKLPKSDWHLETEAAIIEDVLLINVHSRGAAGAGYNLGKADRVTMIGCRGGLLLSAYTKNLTTQGCRFTGSTANDPLSHSSVAPWYPRFNDTEFTNLGDPAGGMLINVGSGGATFNRCTLNQTSTTGFLMLAIESGSDVANTNFIDCIMNDARTASFATQLVGNFYGRTTLALAQNTQLGASRLYGDLFITGAAPASGSVNNISGSGRLFINGTESPIAGKTASAMVRAAQTAGNDGASSSVVCRQIFDYRTTQMAAIFGIANRGDIIWNSLPSAGGNVGWMCIAGGNPGTWKTFGSIAA